MERAARALPRLNVAGGALSAAARDCIFLSTLVALSVALYTRGLGFYSDDWAFLRILETTNDRSFPGLADGLYERDVVIRQRPVQVVYLAALYSAFGLDPLGYHVVNAVVLAAAVVLFYLVLRELEQPRMLAVAVAALYALMPNFSSDRFWIAAHQASVSILFLLVSALAALRSLRAGARGAAALASVSVAALVASGLAYEVTIPLLASVLALVAHRAKRLGLLRGPAARRRVLGLLGAGVAALVAVIAFKADRSVRVGVDQPYGDYLIDLVAGTLRVDVGVYGLALPYVVAWIVARAADGAVLSLGAVVAAAVSFYLYRLGRTGFEDARAGAVRLIGAGFATMVIGYAIFVVPTVISFSSASLGNRIRIAAALGTAALLVGSLVLLASVVRRVAARRVVLAGAVGLLCGAAFIVTNTLALFWVSAYDEQRAIVGRLRADIPRLQPGSTVILDGVCLERGGAYVFTGNRDVTGVLTIHYRQARLRGSAITKSPSIGERGLLVHTFGSPDFFRYGEHLIVYDAARRRVERLVDRAAAARYFRRSPFRPEVDCLPGFAWRGEAPPSES